MLVCGEITQNKYIYAKLLLKDRTLWTNHTHHIVKVDTL